MLTARYQAAPTVALMSRVEHYADPDQVIVVTDSPEAFRASGLAFGIDVAPQPHVAWRSEIRGFRGRAAVFPRRDAAASRDDAFIVTSLSLSF